MPTFNAHASFGHGLVTAGMQLQSNSMWFNAFVTVSASQCWITTDVGSPVQKQSLQSVLYTSLQHPQGIAMPRGLADEIESPAVRSAHDGPYCQCVS